VVAEGEQVRGAVPVEVGAQLPQARHRPVRDAKAADPAGGDLLDQDVRKLGDTEARIVAVEQEHVEPLQAEQAARPVHLRAHQIRAAVRRVAALRVDDHAVRRRTAAQPPARRARRLAVAVDVCHVEGAAAAGVKAIEQAWSKRCVGEVQRPEDEPRPVAHLSRRSSAARCSRAPRAAGG
jgi:hypothetical protein